MFAQFLLVWRKLRLYQGQKQRFRLASVKENMADLRVRGKKSVKIVSLDLAHIGIKTAGTNALKGDIPKCDVLVFQALQTLFVGLIGIESE